MNESKNMTNDNKDSYEWDYIVVLKNFFLIISTKAKRKNEEIFGKKRLQESESKTAICRGKEIIKRKSNV